MLNESSEVGPPPNDRHIHHVGSKVGTENDESIILRQAGSRSDKTRIAWWMQIVASAIIT